MKCCDARKTGDRYDDLLREPPFRGRSRPGSVLEQYRIAHDVPRKEDARYGTDCEIKPCLPISYRSCCEKQRERDEDKAHDEREPRLCLGILHLILD
jgi:hypothetical protein